METNNKLREALTKILDLTNSLDEECAVDPVEIRDIAKAALAEPVRNCEVGTAMEQGELFSAYCRAHKHPESECLPCPLFGQTGGYCELAWAQMPYEEGVPNAE